MKTNRPAIIPLPRFLLVLSSWPRRILLATINNWPRPGANCHCPSPPPAPSAVCCLAVQRQGVAALLVLQPILQPVADPRGRRSPAVRRGGGHGGLGPARRAPAAVEPLQCRERTAIWPRAGSAQEFSQTPRGGVVSILSKNEATTGIRLGN